MKAIAIIGVIAIPMLAFIHVEMLEAHRTYAIWPNELVRSLEANLPILFDLFRLSSVDLRQPATSWSNLGPILQFLGSIALAFVGASLSESGRRLSARITRSEERVEEQIWAREQGIHVQSSPETILINVSNEDKWYARPQGLTGIGVAIAVIAAIIIKVCHLGP